MKARASCFQILFLFFLFFVFNYFFFHKFYTEVGKSVTKTEFEAWKEVWKLLRLYLLNTTIVYHNINFLLGETSTSPSIFLKTYLQFLIIVSYCKVGHLVYL